MAKINAAYSCLGDPTQRAAYDRNRRAHAEFQPEEDNDQIAAFVSALKETEEKWSIACSVYPDLIDLRTRLAKFSTSLSFAFVTLLIEAKAFTRRQQVADHLELTFLQRYFGTDTKILALASSLVLAGERDAAKTLNRLVEVLGSEIDPQLLIDRVESQHHLQEIRKTQERELANKEARENLKRVVLQYGYYADALALMRTLGYKTVESGGGLFSGPIIDITSPSSERISFPGSAAFVDWVKKNICPPTPKS